MPFSPDDPKVEAGLSAGHIIFEFAGLVFPPLAVVANDAQAVADLYKFLSDHVSNHPGLSHLPGPALDVPYPAKW